MGSGGAARSVTHVLTHNFKPKAITFAALYPEQAHAIIDSIGACDDQIQCSTIYRSST